MPFDVIRNDITKVKADAIVNAANTSLLGGGGVDGAIHKAAGEKLLEECRKLGGCETGSAKITSGYNLPCKYVIHAVGPIWRGGNNNEEKLLYSCYKTALELANEHKCKSIAFPLISAGAYGYPKKKAFEVAKKAFRDFLAENEMDIILVIFDKETIEQCGISKSKLKAYIDDFYAEEHYPHAIEYSMAEMNRAPTAPYTFKERIRSFAPEIKSLSKRLAEKELSFSELLLKMIDERGLKDSDVYNAANVTRQVFSKIRSDKNYRPKKTTVLAFAIALRLSLPETEKLLNAAGHVLSGNNEADIIVSYFIETKNYDIYDINITLEKYNLPKLGAV